MRFGPVSIRQAVGGYLAHAVREGAVALKKGTCLTQAHVEALFEAGVAQVTVAQLEPGDIPENAAAERLAAALSGPGLRCQPPFTGRANLFAEASGVLVIDAAQVNAVNALDEALTVATLPAFRAVQAGEMVATVKVIPYAVADALLIRAEQVARGALRIDPFRPKRLGVISTLDAGLKLSVVEKTLKVLAGRLARIDQGASRIVSDIRVHHEAEDVREALLNTRALGAEVILVFGATAIADRRDVIPAALEAAGGQVVHLGMPVDPGNLLLLGRLGEVPVVGAPGCARAPTPNGFDDILERLIADLPVTRADIQAMGVGGLRMEIFSRPQPRAPDMPSSHPAVAAVILAAGSSRRMGRNKLLEPLEHKPMIRHVAEAAIHSRAAPVIIVTGHEADAVTRALEGLDVTFVNNPEHETGMASSLKQGVSAVPESVAGALILLGDMPRLSAPLIDRLVRVTANCEEEQAVVPVCRGQRGNPVIVMRRAFASIAALTGDVGARKFLQDAGADVLEVPVDDDAVLLDFDTDAALAAYRARE